MRLKGELVSSAEITSERRDEMFRLMERYYLNVTKPQFETDLAEKRWVIMLTDPTTCELCGFSTQTLMTIEIDDAPITALFSGDTIIAREHWGDVALAHVWGRLALSLIDMHTTGNLYWFLISKGYKTYRFLPLFFHEYWPRCDTSTPSQVRRVINAFAGHKFPGTYDATTGVVRADRSKDQLRPGVADLTRERLSNRHVRYFVELNPGHVDGDELCCLAPLTRENFTPAAYRVINARSVGISGAA